MKRNITSAAAATLSTLMLTGVAAGVAGAAPRPVVPASPVARTAAPSQNTVAGMRDAYNNLDRAKTDLDAARKAKAPRAKITRLSSQYRAAQRSYAASVANVGFMNVSITADMKAAMKVWVADASAAAKKNPKDAAAARNARAARNAFTAMNNAIAAKSPQAPKKNTTTPNRTTAMYPAGYNPAKDGKYVAPTSVKIVSSTCTALNAPSSRAYHYTYNVEVKGGTAVVTTPGEFHSYLDGGKVIAQYAYDVPGVLMKSGGRVEAINSTYMEFATHSIGKPVMKKTITSTGQGRYIHIPCPALDATEGAVVNGVPTFTPKPVA